MIVKIKLAKSIDKNASEYFEKAKKAKKKILGSEKTLLKYKLKLIEMEDTKKILEEKEKEIIIRKKSWFEKFRWFYTSSGLLAVGGRDATTNEIIIKKHAEKNDLVFHTDMAGSPFFVLKCGDEKPNPEILKEVADAVCTFSRAWKLGIQTQSVFCVNPDQVSKSARPGEHLSKGAFMIYGKTNYIDNKVNLSVGKLADGSIMAAPIECIKEKCEKYVTLIQGEEKVSKVAKYIQLELSADDLDEIIRVLPSGTFKIIKQK